MVEVEAFTYSEPFGYWRPDIERWKYIDDISELQGLEIEVQDPFLKQCLYELKTLYKAMIEELKEYEKRLDFAIVFGGHAERTKEIFEDPDTGVLTCLCLPNDKARLRALEVPMRWIYQLWIMKLTCEALGVERFDYGWWRIEQGKPIPTCTPRRGEECFTLWFEFQPHELAHWTGAFVGRRVPVRPDIIVAKGCLREVDELENTGFIIIECKTGSSSSGRAI